jgi:hypothetical protein
MDVMGILYRESPVITSAPVIVIGGAIIIAVIAAIVAWKLKASIDGGEISELQTQVGRAEAYVDTVKARRQLVFEREEDVLAAQAKLIREFQEYKALLVAGASESQLAAINKIEAALIACTTASTALVLLARQ